MLDYHAQMLTPNGGPCMEAEGGGNEEEGATNDGRSYGVAADRLRRFGRNRSSMRREASKSNSFSPQSEQISSWRFGTSAVLRRTVAFTVTISRRIRRLLHVGHRRIAIRYPSTALFEEIKM